MRISDWSSDVCSSDLLRQGFFKDAFTAQAGAIVGHLDDDLSAMMLSGQSHVALGAFTCGGSHFGQLDAMVNAVAHQVGQGIDNALDKARSEEHTSELQSLMRISYAVFCVKKKKKHNYKT